ncbi:prolyl-tRNA synthetase associated domain-containing protein [Anaerotignum sp. MB30-C6]|uniref:prolyl-tRNA synthetase associated domain-containing protein n=1 Tax=Anaerotignum sp. MB30-C6 TaxID=3070814 RepID=UPI0027DBFB38|nr:prolyl-tRNA synthetase associated domain-containing protein [Anaerotignum sp. MB30-C6]WMI80227.1 prolyl-tRNA synthetase associated domain-containing protein [Anaerotignum sp. MB30-C6]
MYNKEEVRKLLDKKGIAYEWVDHEAAYTIDDMVRLGLDTDLDVAKNLFLRDGKGANHYLIVLRADKKVDLKTFGKTLGLTRLSFASEERLEKYLGLKKGAVTPLGILNDTERSVKVFFDKDFVGVDRIGVHPNDNTASIYLAPKDVFDIIKEHGNELEIVEIPR